MTIASMLQKKGYRTACIGKWHLGLGWRAKEGSNFDFDKPWPWPGGTMPREEESKIDFAQPVLGGPVELGFDYFFGSSACPTCNTPYCFIEQDKIVNQPNLYYEGQYLEQRNGYRSPDWEETEVDPRFTHKAIDFIKQVAGNSEPFFLYLSSSSPHEPCEEAVVPEFMRGASKAGARGDMVALFDWMVGEIMQTLEDNGLFDNTITTPEVKNSYFRAKTQANYKSKILGFGFPDGYRNCKLEGVIYSLIIPSADPGRPKGSWYERPLTCKYYIKSI